MVEGRVFGMIFGLGSHLLEVNFRDYTIYVGKRIVRLKKGGRGRGGAWSWNWDWRRNPFDRELN